MHLPIIEWFNKQEGELTEVLANNKIDTLPRSVPTPDLLPAVEQGYYRSLLKLYNEFKDKLVRTWDNAFNHLLQRIQLHDSPGFMQDLDKFRYIVEKDAAHYFDTVTGLGRSYLAASYGFDPFEGKTDELDNIHTQQLNTFKDAVSKKLCSRIVDTVHRVYNENLKKDLDIEKAASPWTPKRIKALLETYAGAVFSVFSAVNLVGTVNVMRRNLSPAVLERTRTALEGAGDVMMEWVGVGDERTCPTCNDMINGSPYLATELLSTGIWPTHGTQCGGNCRCFLRPVSKPPSVEEVIETVEDVADTAAQIKGLAQTVGYLRVRTDISKRRLTDQVNTLLSGGASLSEGVGGIIDSPVTLTPQQHANILEAITGCPLLRRRGWWRGVDTIIVGKSTSKEVLANFVPESRTIEISLDIADDVLQLRKYISHEVAHHIYTNTPAGQRTAFRDGIYRLRESRLTTVRDQLAAKNERAAVLRSLNPDNLSKIWEQAVRTRDFSKVDRIIHQLRVKYQITPPEGGFTPLFSDEEYFANFFSELAMDPVYARLTDSPMERVFYFNFRSVFEPYASRRFITNVKQPSDLMLYRQDLPSRAKHITPVAADMDDMDVVRRVLTPPELHEAKYGLTTVARTGDKIRFVPSELELDKLMRDIGLPAGIKRSEFFRHLEGIHVAFNPSDLAVIQKTGPTKGQVRQLAPGELNAMRSSGYITINEFKKRYGNVPLAYDVDDRILYINHDEWLRFAKSKIHRERVFPSKRPPGIKGTKPPDHEISWTMLSAEPLEEAERSLIDAVTPFEYGQANRDLVTFGLGLHNYNVLRETKNLAPVRKAYYKYVKQAVTGMRTKFGERGWIGYEKRASALLDILERTPGKVTGDAQNRLRASSALSLSGKAAQLQGGLTDVRAFSGASLQDEASFFAGWLQLYASDPTRASYYAPDLVRVVREVIPNITVGRMPAKFRPQLNPAINERLFRDALNRLTRTRSTVNTLSKGIRKTVLSEKENLQSFIVRVNKGIRRVFPLVLNPLILRNLSGISYGIDLSNSPETVYSIYTTKPFQLEIFLSDRVGSTTYIDTIRLIGLNLGRHLINTIRESRVYPKLLTALNQEYKDKLQVDSPLVKLQEFLGSEYAGTDVNDYFAYVFTVFIQGNEKAIQAVKRICPAVYDIITRYYQEKKEV